MKLVLVLVLVLGCKTDETPKPKPSSTQVAPTPPSTPAPPPPEAPPELTTSQKALATRLAVISKVAVTAKKNQGNCQGLTDAAAALASELRATAGVRSDLDAADAAIEQRQLTKVLSIVIAASKGCDTAALDPLTDQLSESASSK